MACGPRDLSVARHGEEVSHRLLQLVGVVSGSAWSPQGIVTTLPSGASRVNRARLRSPIGLITSSK